MDYLYENLWLLWLIWSVVCLLSELTSGDFYLVCSSVGALVAMVGALLGLPFWGQVFLWVAASLVCIFFLRPPLLKRMHGKAERKSNADALIGRKGTVIEAIPAGGHGYVKIDGDEWRSVSADGAEIACGTTVTVVSRESIVLTVTA